MPKKSFVANLTAIERDQLDAEIRRRCYCECIPMAEWVFSRFGVKTSKSAMQAYSRSLMAADGIQGTAGSVKALASMSKAPKADK